MFFLLPVSAGYAAGITWSPARPALDLPVSSQTQTARNAGLAGDGAGTWLLPYSNDDIGEVVPSEFLYAVSTDNGITWEGPRQVLAGGPGESQGAATIVSNRAGGWLSAWITRTGADFSIKTATTTDPQGAWTGTGSPLGGTTTSTIESIALKNNGRGGWLLAWTETAGTTGTLRAVASSNNGATWSAGTTLAGPGVSGRPSIVYLPTGHWLVGYHGRGSGTDLEGLSARLTGSGDLLTTAAINNDEMTETDEDYFPSLGMHGGSVTAVWARQDAPWTVLSARSADGVSWTTASVVTDAVEFVAAAKADPFVVSNAKGDWLTLFSSTDIFDPEIPRELYYSRSLDNGGNWDVQEALDPDFSETTAPKWLSPVAAPNGPGRWLAAWTADPARTDADETPGASPYATIGLELDAPVDDGPTTTDLRLTISPWPSPAIAGKYLGYVVTVQNVGPQAARRVVLDVPVNGPVFNHAVASQGEWNVGALGGATNVRTLLGNIGAGKRASFSLAVTPNAGPATINYSGSVRFDGLDLNPADNQVAGQVPVTVAAPVTPPVNPPPAVEPPAENIVSWAGLSAGKNDKLQGTVVVETAGLPKGATVEVWGGASPGEGKPLKKLKIKAKKGGSITRAGISVKVKGAKPGSLTAVLRGADGGIIDQATAPVE